MEEFHPTAKRRRDATTVRPLPLHLEVHNQSPTGFAWGYGGSGPAQLALALLMDATGDAEISLRYYQTLKRRFISGWKSEWSITATEILAFVAEEERSRGASRCGMPLQ